LVGFLGPNGAGKATTLKMLSGLLYPSSGAARVLGYVPWERDDGYRRQFALLLGQKNQLWWDLPAQESFELNARIYGIPPLAMQRTVSDMSALLGVRDKLNVSVRELSLGERAKMELIGALLHQPKVLFLDEPTIGLDVVSQKTVREFLREHNARHKTTIVLTSHYMADIQELCQRVIIIDHGTIFFDGRLSDILDRFADSKLVTIQCEGTASISAERLAYFGEIVEQTPGRASGSSRSARPCWTSLRSAISTSRKSRSRKSSVAFLPVEARAGQPGGIILGWGKGTRRLEEPH
jgi:ABC-2 type transport system ATP-binding protein